MRFIFRFQRQTIKFEKKEKKSTSFIEPFLSKILKNLTLDKRSMYSSINLENLQNVYQVIRFSSGVVSWFYISDLLVGKSLAHCLHQFHIQLCKTKTKTKGENRKILILVKKAHHRRPWGSLGIISILPVNIPDGVKSASVRCS